MDTFTNLVLIFIAFIALQQHLSWLFFVIMGILFFVSTDWIMRIVVVASIIVFLLLPTFANENWLIIFVAVAGINVVLGERKQKAPASSEYSPELMRLLGEG